MIQRFLRSLHAPCVLLLGVCLLATSVSRPALAQTKTIAVCVDGIDAGHVGEAVLKAIGGAADVLDEQAFRTQLARFGPTPLSRGTDLEPKEIDRLRKAGRAVGAEAVVVAREHRDSTSRWVLLTVLDVDDGSAPVKKIPLDFKSRENDRDAIAFALGASLDKYAPQPQATGRPGPGPAHEERLARPLTGTIDAQNVHPPAAVGGRTTPAQLVSTSPFEVALGIEALGRQFSYDNGISPHPSVYRMFPARSARVGGKVFPLAAMGRPWSDIGFAADYSLTFLQRSDLQGALSSAMPTSHSFSLCARIHPGSDAGVLLGACLGYAFTSFGRLGPPATELPDVTYRSLRPALDARIAFGRFSILSAVAFRAILDADGISARFYSPRGYGLDGEIGGALMYFRRLEARLVARYERYSFGFTPPPGASFAAGDALDHVYGIRLSLAFVY